MGAMAEHQDAPLFRVSNHHTQSCGDPPQVDGDHQGRYHGYFENEHGEQAVFTYDYETDTGTLLMGDAGWAEPRTVIDGEPGDVVLSPQEVQWLIACWEAATAGRRR